jgi:glycosyltransferase involved in cell wall biosynthesis
MVAANQAVSRDAAKIAVLERAKPSFVGVETTMSRVSVVILTLNEEINLGDCLESCKWCDDVVVFDSYSSDRTCSIAESMGARVVQRRFDNYAAQRNAALSEVQYKHPWVLMVDADERVTSELAQEIATTPLLSDPAVTLVRMRRKDYFLGRWLRHSSQYPTWFGRLLRVGRAHIEREVNEESVTDGKIAFLEGHLAHFPFSRGTAHWLERHNRYSTMEARVKQAQGGTLSPISFFARDPALRRQFLKQLAYRTYGRPLLMFVYLYFFRLGLLDGLPGLYFSALRAGYELVIDIKALELQRRAQNLPL